MGLPTVDYIVSVKNPNDADSAIKQTYGTAVNSMSLRTNLYFEIQKSSTRKITYKSDDITPIKKKELSARILKR